MGRIFYNPNTSGGLEVLAADPAQPSLGDHWLNTTEGVIKYFDGQSIQEIDNQPDVPDAHQVFNQSPPSSVWNINHGLGKFPSVTVLDSAGTNVSGCVEHLDANNLRITFSSGFSGTAYLN